MTPKYHNDGCERNHIAIFAGSFNPFTIGHLDILKRGLKLFDAVYVVRGINKSKSVNSAEICDLEFLEKYFSGVKVMSWDGLTVDCAKAVGAEFLLRGARSGYEFEQERTLAEINYMISGLETVILMSRPTLSSISSSMIRELEAFGKDSSEFYAVNNL